MSTSSTQWWVLLQHQKELESLLTSTSDLSHLFRKLMNNNVLSQDFGSKFSSLDPDPDHLEPEVKVRYLLQHVLERVREDGKLFKRLVGVLSRLGGKVKDECDAMNRGVAQERTSSQGTKNDIKLVTKDVPYLVKSLVLCSHLWEEIGIALDIPEYKRDDCKRNSEKNVIRLESLLRTYVQGDYEGAEPATFNRLKDALAGNIVKRKVLAHRLEMPTCESEHALPNTSSFELEILDQTYNTEVAEGKSTLLEVQVSSSGYESYQWSKDGKPLLDRADLFGVCSNILYIDKASKGSEGKYSCRVSRSDETKCSDEISLSVVYPPEKRELLKFYSNSERKSAKNSWPPTGNSEFINLALIKKVERGKNKCDYYTVRGDMDDILESKEVAEYEKVFKEYKEGGLLLVEGRPGCGKTTLVHKITRDWMEGKKILQGARMVFLVTLRLVNESGKDKSLLDLLQIFYGKALGKNIEQKLDECRGKGACFILDGLDEYPIEKKKNLVIDDLLNTRTLLPDSMLIVASRPVATNELKQRCKTRIEVIGFHKDQIYSYVRSYPFPSSDMVVKMEEYLEQHPNVLHMCYLPVHAAMICFLFSKLEANIPQTETQIYEQFTIATILRHEANRSEGLSQIKSLMELNGEEKTLFISVCKLAYDMIINSQQVVKKSNAQISVSSNLDFGLLTVERTCEYYGSEDLYTFHHLTFQEFLAAFYIREAQIESEVLLVKKSLRNVLKFYCGLTQLFKDIEFANVICTMLNYFSFHLQCAFESQHVQLCDTVVEDSTIAVGGDIVSSIAQGYVLSNCTKPVTEVRVGRTWDNDGVESFASMATSGRLQSIKTLCLEYRETVNDEWFVSINSLLCHLRFLEELDLTGTTPLTKSGIECLTSGITLPQLKVLRISLPLIPPCSHPEKVLSLLKFRTNKIQQILYEVHTDYAINHVVWRKILSYAFSCQVIQDSDLSWLHLYNSVANLSLYHERLSCCTEVVLVNCCIGDEETEILASSLNSSVLEKLVLDFNRISDSGAIALACCLARCSVVQEVSLQCNSIGDLGATALADALIHCSSLRRLNLQGNSRVDIVAIARATESLPGLDLCIDKVHTTEEGIERVLERRTRTSIKNKVFTSSTDSICKADIDSLRRALHCGDLPALRLSKTNISNINQLVAEQENAKTVRGIECIDISDDTVPTICSILKCLPHLHYIKINLGDINTSTQLISDSLKTLKSLHSLTLRHVSHHSSIVLEAVKCFTELHSLDLYGCHVGSKEMGLLCSNTEFWVNLHTLNLEGNNFGSDGAQILSKMLVHCKSLCCLNLLGNDIDDRAVMAIAEGLKDHTGLLELQLGYNDVTSAGVASLSQVISCNQQLKCLELTNCNLGPENVTVLVDLMSGDSLQILDLEENGLDDDSMACLSVGLKKFTQLVKLNIGCNRNSFHGVEHLSEGLQYCTKLQELYLGANDVIQDCIPAILDIMKHCMYLKRLSLAFSFISVDDAALLLGGWQHKSLLILSIRKGIGHRHVKAMYNNSEHCDSCNHLLQLYYNNDFVDLIIENIPLRKLVSL